MDRLNKLIDISIAKDFCGQRSVQGLRTPGLLARRPLIGLLMVLLGGVVFGVIAWSFQTGGRFAQLDVSVADRIHAVALQSPKYVVDLMILGFYLGEHGIVLIGFLLLACFGVKRFWPEFTMVVVAWAGEGLIWTVLSGYFNRPRPEFDVSVWRQMTVPGFPSGHSISAVMCFGLLAYLVVPFMRRRVWKAVVIAAAVGIILFIGFSRIFVGDHYLTDVLAGYALGIAWCGLAYTVIELLFKRRILENVQPK
ncbi:MAG: phosphatase PAP2 family protein [Thermoflexales bacterium]|nr:phosphatase PAP2 family protein [Thermoflexales bacterium]